MSVGYLADSFDLINVRDLDLIAQARARCARLVVGVFTDDYVERVSGRRPVIPLSERMAVLQQVRGIVEVVAHDDVPLLMRPPLSSLRLLMRRTTWSRRRCC